MYYIFIRGQPLLESLITNITYCLLHETNVTDDFFPGYSIYNDNFVFFYPNYFVKILIKFLLSSIDESYVISHLNTCSKL